MEISYSKCTCLSTAFGRVSDRCVKVGLSNHLSEGIGFETLFHTGDFITMKKIMILALVAASAASFAQTAFWGGTLTANDPTFNRAGEDGTFISGVGTDNYYHVQDFWVTATGDYTFESAFANDGFIFVYTSFDPNDVLTGFVAGDDDYTGSFALLGGSANGLDGSKIGGGQGTFPSMNLVANTQYRAVTTTFDIFTTGDYRNAIGGGPGTVNLGTVPEPASMVALGAGLLALARRRRSK